MRFATAFAAPFVGVKPALRGWIHAVAAVAAVVLAPLVIVFAPSGTRMVAAIYTGGVIAMFTTSALYHRFAWSPGIRGLWKRLDHSMIFVAIAGTYTPVALFTLPENTGRVVLTVVWVGALVGTALQFGWPSAPGWVTIIPYLACGWAVLPVIGQVWANMHPAGFVLLLAGGVAFSTGAAVYATKRPDPWPRWFGFHEIFHALVTVGIALHYVSVTFFALPNGPAGVA